MKFQPHQQRVLDEKAELDKKIIKLDEFIKTSQIFAELPDEERELLIRQKSCMSEYSEILGARSDAFTA
jgi:hypothetical protein